MWRSARASPESREAEGGDQCGSGAGLKRFRASLSRREALSLGAAFLVNEAIGEGMDRDLASVDVDLAGVPRGKSLTIKWKGKLVFVRHRTEAEIHAARTVPPDKLIDPQTDEARVHRREWIVVVGECTHAGCRPIEGLGRYGGWLCLCHGSDFDTSGRVRKGPALKNLNVPPYEFIASERLRIGREAAKR